MDSNIPQNIDIERAVLGAMLIDPSDAISCAIQNKTHEGHFFLPEHGIIFKALVYMYNNSIPIDQLTVSEMLKKYKSLVARNWEIEVGGLISDTISAANIKYHLGILADLYNTRKLISLATSIINQAEAGISSFDILEGIEKNIVAIQDEKPSDNIVHISDLCDTILADIKRLSDLDGATSGVDTGYKYLNLLLGGFQKGTLNVLAARPSQGKSALGQGFARAAGKMGVPTLVFSLEMSNSQLMQRFLSQESGVNMSVLKHRALTIGEWRALSMANGILHNLPVHLTNIGVLSIWQLSAIAKQYKRDKKIGLIIVDYIQLMTGDTKNGREREIASISGGLKNLAMTLDIPIVALAQLNRKVEEIKRRPKLSDLRESGAIENDADVVMMLHNPELESFDKDGYERYDFQPDVPVEAMRELIVEKHRDGETGTIYLGMDKKTVQFKNVTYSPRGVYQNEQSHNPVRSNSTGGNSNYNSYYDKE